ncbi:hypothetical protein DMB92_05355 [Campylobacter sp. MIT 99-7217]|uniref:hypothetical protein n=1 Tax=Campylobacter sp. MIT 99-7217 TaxID=535091 RepID=UPI00115C0F08|nr:hypothetical protein [Campylobacter sp. MIT 99-7217]TQR31816.1 hypothetical protein DMB92_05355 [Campylobacter sp. MIT 99-7217]
MNEADKLNLAYEGGASTKGFSIDLKRFELKGDDELSFAKNARVQSFIEKMESEGFCFVTMGADFLTMVRIEPLKQSKQKIRKFKDISCL